MKNIFVYCYAQDLGEIYFKTRLNCKCILFLTLIFISGCVV